jgi:hypothetical protein
VVRDIGTRRGSEHTGSLPCLSFCRLRGRHARRVGCVVGPAAVSETVAHEVGDDVNVYPIPSQLYYTESLDGFSSRARRAQAGKTY